MFVLGAAHSHKASDAPAAIPHVGATPGGAPPARADEVLCGAVCAIIGGSDGKDEDAPFVRRPALRQPTLRQPCRASLRGPCWRCAQATEEEVSAAIDVAVQIGLEGVRQLARLEGGQMRIVAMSEKKVMGVHVGDILIRVGGILDQLGGSLRRLQRSI